MPRKSRHRKDKRVPHSPTQPLVRPGAAVASATMAVPNPRTPAKSYPYVNRELRTAALLAGIILVILIVVALISR